ncbi:uncharacterized protein [Typha angustifolia]|uniref:uncharacterized protein n=1 Tax=Typha angustifolia TaxID=59011 RepID=UPI003C2F6486
MASPFSYLSSPESDDSAVDAIISEATDLCALEHIASLNTSHLSDSSLLPADLDARFRKLKSFPVAKPHSQPTPKRLDHEKENVPRTVDPSESIPKSPIDANKPEVPIPSQESGEAGRFSHEKGDAFKGLEPKLGSGFSPSPSKSHCSRTDSPSPPRQACCFGFSPKKIQKNSKAKKDGIFGLDLDVGDWGDSDKVLSELKQHRQKLKKALKEQERVRKEAAQIVKQAKQTSARMNAPALDDWMSDDEEFK